MTDIPLSVRRDRQRGLVWWPEKPTIVRRLGKNEVELAKAGVCPWCGRGPFTVLAGHTFKAHGVDRFELRDHLGLCYNESICDPTHSRACAERGQRIYATGRSGIRGGSKGKGRKLSEKAQKLNAEKLKQAQAVVDHAALGEYNSRQRRAASADRDAQIVQMWNNGELLGEIAAKMGLAPATVRNAVDRADVEAPDGRARYHARRRGVDSPALQAWRETRAKKLRLEREAIAEQVEAGRPVREIADDMGVSRKTLVARLRRRGIAVPDGRSDPARPKPPPRPKAPGTPCSQAECERLSVARGLCKMHYQRWRKAQGAKTRAGAAP